MQDGWSEFAQHAARVAEFQALDHLSESDTRAFLIDPVLRLLGYIGVGDIRREVSVKETREFLDYELRANGKPCAIVEAKSLKASVTDSATAQCVQYAAINGVRWCVITNGVIWAVYDSHAKGALAEKQVDTVTLDSDGPGIARCWEVLSLMSRSNMEAGGGFTPLLIERVLRDELNRPDSSAIRALRSALRERLQENFSASDVVARVNQIVNSTVVITESGLEPPVGPVSLPTMTVPSIPQPTFDESHEAMDVTRRVRISALVKAGLLKPGDELTAQGGALRITVTADGKLAADGSIEQNLWNAAGKLGVSVGGAEIWNFWHGPDGQPMSTYRARFIQMTAST